MALRLAGDGHNFAHNFYAIAIYSNIIGCVMCAQLMFMRAHWQLAHMLLHARHIFANTQINSRITNFNNNTIFLLIMGGGGYISRRRPEATKNL